MTKHEKLEKLSSIAAWAEAEAVRASERRREILNLGDGDELLQRNGAAERELKALLLDTRRDIQALEAA